MKKFKIPVTWMVWDKVEVEADTLEDAIKWVKDNIDEIPLGTEPEYVEDSYRIDGDDGFCSNQDLIKYLKECWNLSGELDGEEIEDVTI